MDRLYVICSANELGSNYDYYKVDFCVFEEN